MEENNYKKKGKRYLVIGIVVLFLAILGSSVAYYLARVSGNLSGRAAGTELTLDITPLSTSATDDLIPLDNDKDTLTMAVLGYGNETTNFDATKSCIDINGYSVCQVYKITLTNKGTVPVVVNSTVDLYGDNTPNIDCARMDSSTSVTNNASCKGNNTLANNERINGNTSKEYYVIVYINNLDVPQEDKGEFNGTVTFTSTQGKKIKGRFKAGENLVEHITDLYKDSPKTVVTARADCEKPEDGTFTYEPVDYAAYGRCLVYKELDYDYAITKTIDYNYARDVNLMNDRLGGTSEDLDGGNIRYYGDNPNNYIDIGDKYTKDYYQWQEMGYESLEACSNIENSTLCEISHSAGDPILYRIIGVFDDKVKVIREDSIGTYSWDTSSSDINNGIGINQWGPSSNYTGADLMKLLNPGNDSNKDLNGNNEEITVNNSLWWNSEKGTCYNGDKNQIIECDFTSTGLSENVKSIIATATWYLGGFGYGADKRINYNSIPHSFNYTDNTPFANQAYNYERSNSVYDKRFIDCNHYNRSDYNICNDNVTRTTTWDGKIGLLYPSDVGYANDLFIPQKYNTIKQVNSVNWINYSKDGVYGEYTITPNSLAPDSVYIINGYYGDIEQSYINKRSYISEYIIRPTFYLDSSVTIENSGDGSKDNPYVVVY